MGPVISLSECGDYVTAYVRSLGLGLGLGLGLDYVTAYEVIRVRGLGEG